MTSEKMEGQKDRRTEGQKDRWKEGRTEGQTDPLL